MRRQVEEIDPGNSAFAGVNRHPVGDAGESVAAFAANDTLYVLQCINTDIKRGVGHTPLTGRVGEAQTVGCRGIGKNARIVGPVIGATCPVKFVGNISTGSIKSVVARTADDGFNAQ